MEKELKEETVTTLKSGIEFLGDVKKELGVNNELKTKLIHMNYLFEILVNKWENLLNHPGLDTDKRSKNSKSFPLIPKKMPLNQDVNKKQEETELVKKEFSKSVEFLEKKEERTNKSKSLLQIFKRRSTIEDVEPEVSRERKTLSERMFVQVPAQVQEDINENGYLEILKPDSNRLMYSNNKFNKTAKIKLKVNEKAVGSRYCCLLDSIILLGKALDDQPPEYELKVEEYRVTNHKEQVFDLVKKDVTLSLRFPTESECSDWYDRLDHMIQSDVYSYVTVNASRSSIAKKDKEVVNYENVCKKKTPVPPRNSSAHRYSYPKFSENPKKLDSCEYVKMDDDEPNVIRSLDSNKDTSHSVEPNQMKRSTNVLTKKPVFHKYKLGRDRSLSTEKTEN